MAHGYTVDFLDLLHPDGQESRVIHVLLGRLGQLFVDLNDPIAVTKGTNKIVVQDEDNGKQQIYDNFEERWVTLTEDMIDSIPPTFTFAPQPTSVLMELDYFIRAAGLVKHFYVWSTNSIPMNVYCDIRSDKNNFYRGRYTVTPWLPHISSMIQIRPEHTFYEISDEDWEIYFG